MDFVDPHGGGEVNLPHLGLQDVEPIRMGRAPTVYYTHRDCTKGERRWPLLTLGCWVRGEVLQCDACHARFGKKVVRFLERDEIGKVVFQPRERIGSKERPAFRDYLGYVLGASLSSPKDSAS